MASCGMLPSDPDILLDIIPDKSDSDDDFDVYLEPEDSPIPTATLQNLRR